MPHNFWTKMDILIIVVHDKRLISKVLGQSRKLSNNALLKNPYWLEKISVHNNQNMRCTYISVTSLVECTVSQQGVDFSKKISKIKIIFWFDFHRWSHGPSKIGHHFRTLNICESQSGSKIDNNKKTFF